MSSVPAGSSSAVPPHGGGRRAEPLDRRHMDRRELISKWLLPAVERLLERESYAALTVEQMAAEAGISRSTFYNYFEDKDDLVRALTRDVMATITDASRVWWMLPPAADKDDLRAALSHLLQVYSPHAVLMRAVADTITHNSRVAAEFDDSQARATASIADFIRGGKAAGVFRADLDAVAAAEWLIWGLERGLSQLAGRDAQWDPERVLTALVDLVWKTLR